jgi:hypothetical protein
MKMKWKLTLLFSWNHVRIKKNLLEFKDKGKHKSDPERGATMRAGSFHNSCAATEENRKMSARHKQQADDDSLISLIRTFVFSSCVFQTSSCTPLIECSFSYFQSASLSHTHTIRGVNGRHHYTRAGTSACFMEKLLLLLLVVSIQ